MIITWCVIKNVILLKYMVNRFLTFSKPPLKENLDELVANRKKEILFLLVEGLSNKDIGANYVFRNLRSSLVLKISINRITLGNCDD